jgi:branched-chain amino acid transport system substrate-binding protein
MQRTFKPGLALAACLAALGVAACGSDDGDAGAAEDGSETLTIYSSLPLTGDSRALSVDIERGERAALEEAGGRAGKYKIRFVSLDDALASAGKWDAGKTSANARKVITDESAIAYLGEYNSGASAVSIPITNDGGLLQVSPGNTYAGLTRADGADEGEPDKFYPSGERTYGRVIPADHIQAAAQATYMKEEGCTGVYILNDKEVYGKGIADVVAKDAAARGIAVKGNDGIDTKAINFRAVAGKISESGADCFFFGGVTPNKSVQVFKDVNAANPDMKLFGPDGVADSPHVSELGPKVEKMTYITNPTLDPKLYPPRGQEFLRAFKAKYGKDPEPYAIYGYEAMSVVLDAIRRGGDDRQAVVRAFFDTRDRQSVLGTYSIDDNGDTTLTDYGANRVQDGKLVFDKVIKAKTR